MTGETGVFCRNVVPWWLVQPCKPSVNESLTFGQQKNSRLSHGPGGTFASNPVGGATGVQYTR
ncbi:MAG: hypothetical protein KDB01_20060, partial [Planctomycetaceae bacterium]|nr:hypothetical protein [Planctomycetaceae bacterium]